MDKGNGRTPRCDLDAKVKVSILYIHNILAITVSYTLTATLGEFVVCKKFAQIYQESTFLRDFALGKSWNICKNLVWTNNISNCSGLSSSRRVDKKVYKDECTSSPYSCRSGEQ